MAEDTAVSRKSGGTDKGTADSMGVSSSRGSVAKAGFAAAVGTAEVDGPSVVCIGAAARVN